MSLYNELSKYDIETIESWIDQYAGLERHREADLSHILRFWDSEKSKYLYKLLGDSLTYSFPVEYQKSDNEISHEIESAWYKKGSKLYEFATFLDDLGDILWYVKFNFEDIASERPAGYTTRKKVIYDYFHTYINFYNTKDVRTDVNRIYNGYSRLHMLSSLTSNKYEGPNFMLYDNLHDKYIEITSGMKVLKALRKIAKIFNQVEAFERFSEGITSFWYVTSISNEIVLSIHPMDYMTMSDTNNWGSCMSWVDRGDYRRGTIEMMNSPMVVVAYITHKDSRLFVDSYHDWNDKQWRELFIVTKDVISGVKGYQFWNHSLEDMVIKELHKLAEQNLGWKYNDFIYEYSPSNWFNLVTGDEISITYTTDAMYNDMCYAEHRCIVGEDVCGQKYIHYSGRAVCLGCGQEISIYDLDNDDQSWLLVCPHCGGLEQCVVCGTWESARYMYDTSQGYVCENCYENASICPICEQPIFDNDYGIEIHIAKDGEIFKYRSIWIHEDCVDNEYFKKDIIHVQTLRHDSWGFVHKMNYINYEDLENADIIARNLFGIWSWDSAPNAKISINPENDSLLYKK